MTSLYRSRIRNVFGAYVDDLLDGRNCRRTLWAGALPALADLLTEIALGSPAILAAAQPQCLGTQIGVVCETSPPGSPSLIADAFWRLFNQPAVISLLRQNFPPRLGSRRRDESAYWRLVLHYCRQGNLQAVLDEQWHLLWDQECVVRDARCRGRLTAEGARSRSRRNVCIRSRARVHAEFFETTGARNSGPHSSNAMRSASARCSLFASATAARKNGEAHQPGCMSGPPSTARSGPSC